MPTRDDLAIIVASFGRTNPNSVSNQNSKQILLIPKNSFERIDQREAWKKLPLLKLRICRRRSFISYFKAFLSWSGHWYFRTPLEVALSRSATVALPSDCNYRYACCFSYSVYLLHLILIWLLCVLIEQENPIAYGYADWFTPLSTLTPCGVIATSNSTARRLRRMATWQGSRSFE